MKRFFLILLLLMMPLQAAWAAGAVYCSHDEATMHPGHHVHKHPSSSSQDDDTPSGDCDDCDACHHLSASAMLSSQPNLPLPKGAPHMRGELRRYVSHVADLVPPPNRPARA
jgi:cytochrome c553